MPLGEECSANDEEACERVISGNAAATHISLFGDQVVTAETGRACTLVPMANTQQECIQRVCSPEQPTHNM